MLNILFIYLFFKFNLSIFFYLEWLIYAFVLGLRYKFNQSIWFHLVQKKTKEKLLFVIYKKQTL